MFLGSKTHSPKAAAAAAASGQEWGKEQRPQGDWGNRLPAATPVPRETRVAPKTRIFLTEKKGFQTRDFVALRAESSCLHKWTTIPRLGRGETEAGTKEL